MWQNDIAEVHQAFAFLIGHEICHFILGHRPFGDVKADVARANEASADRCASDRLKAAGYDSDYVVLGLQVLMVNGFTQTGQFVFHPTHPHTMCRLTPVLGRTIQAADRYNVRSGVALYHSLGFTSSAELNGAFSEVTEFYVESGRESCENREPSIEPNARVRRIIEAIQESMGVK